MIQKLCKTDAELSGGGGKTAHNQPVMSLTDNSVLLTVIGAVAADISIKYLKSKGFRLVGCGATPKSWNAGSAGIDAYYQAPLIFDTKAYLNFIKDVCIKENVRYVIPFLDPEIDLFAQHIKWFEEHDIILCMSNPTTVKIVRNKKTLADFVANNCPGINSIPTEYLRDIDTLEWDFPIVVKPYNGRSSIGVQYIHNTSEWDCFRRNADKDLYIVEPFIYGPIVMVEIIRQPDTHQVVAMSRRELISTPHGLSTAAYVFQDETLEYNAQILADKLDIRGNVNFEYIQSPDRQYHFVECNPRFSAGLSFSCMGGYDIVTNHLKCFTGQHIDDYRFNHTMVISRRFEDVLTAKCTEVPYCDTLKH